MKKDVLVLEYQEVFEEKVAVRIAYQDENVLKRGVFYDEEIGVFSCWKPQFIQDELHIRGEVGEHDNIIFVVNIEDAVKIKEKVKKINEKYGIEQWRACRHSNYYFIKDDCTIKRDTECNTVADNKRYIAGNYFKTEEQALEGLKIAKKAISEYLQKLLEVKMSNESI